MRKILFIILLIVVISCDTDQKPDNFFESRLTKSEKYFSLFPNESARIGEYLIFQLEKKEQPIEFSFDSLWDSFDPNTNGIYELNERGIDVIPVFFRRPSNNTVITLKYRLETSHDITFRLKKPDGSLQFELNSTTTEAEISIGSDFVEGVWFYELESPLIQETISATLLDSLIEGETSLPINGVIVQPDWSRIPIREERISLDPNYLEEDTYILISDLSCINCVFSGSPEVATTNQMLDKFNFRGADFSFSNFSYGSFVLGQFGLSEVGGIPRANQFNNANMKYCNFNRSTFYSDTNITQTTLSTINFSNANFQSSSFVEAKIIGCYGLTATFEGCSMGPCIILNNEFVSSNFVGLTLANSDIRYNNFQQSNFSATDLYNSDISYSSFRRAIISSCDMKLARAIGTNFCNISQKFNVKIDSMTTDTTTLCFPF